MTHNEQLLILALAKSVAHLTDAILDLAKAEPMGNESSALQEAKLAREQLGTVADLMGQEWGAHAKSKVD